MDADAIPRGDPRIDERGRDAVRRVLQPVVGQLSASTPDGDPGRMPLGRLDQQLMEQVCHGGLLA
jgi:hypothetical protein